MADATRSISIGGDVIRSVLITGDHARVFVGPYEPIAASYIAPGPVYDQLDLDRFVGRQWLVDRFDQFLDTHESGYFLLEADAGLGKTAFLAWLARRRGYVHHFVQLGKPGQDGIADGLRNLAAQLVRAWQLDTDLVEASLPAAALRPQFLLGILREAARVRDERRPDERIVLVVDGLDGADRLPGQNNLGLPRQLPPGVYVLASLRPSDVALQVDTARQVFQLQPNDALNLADMRLFLGRTAERLGAPDPVAFTELLLERSRGVWIYLSYVIGELERGQRSLQMMEQLPYGLWQYYAEYWVRWRNDHSVEWDETHLRLLATLGAVTEALPLEALCTLAGVTGRVSRRLLEEQWRPFLSVAPGRERCYGLYHASIRDFLHGRVDLGQLMAGEQGLMVELEEATTKAHIRIAARYLEAWGRLDSGLPRLRDPVVAALDDAYGLRHLTWHLDHGDADSLHRLLAVEWSDEGVVPRPRWRSRNAWHATAERAGDSARYLDDVTRAWRSAEAATSRESERDGPASSLALVLRYALITASIRSIAANVPPRLLRDLVEKGIWTARQGLAYARQIPEARWRVEALASVAASLPDDERSRAVHEALAAARLVDDEAARAEALIALAPSLSRSLLNDALAVASDIGHWRPRTQALAALAVHLTEEGRTNLLDVVLTSLRAVHDQAAKSTMLTTLAPVVPKDLLTDAVAAAAGIDDGMLRVTALSALALHVPEPARADVVSMTLASARSIDDESERTAALAAMTPFLPESFFEVILAGARVTEPESRRAEVLASLGPYLSGGLIAEAVEVAEAMTDESCRADALQTLGPHLPELLLAEAIAAAQLIGHERWRLQVLAELRSLMPGPARIRMLEASLVEAGRIEDERLRAESIAGLAPKLPGPMLAEALEIARRIEAGPWRSEAVAALSPHLPGPLLEDALDAIWAIEDRAAQAYALLELAQDLPVHVQREALIIATSIPDEQRRAEVLAELAPQLAEPLAIEALAAARTLADEKARGGALVTLTSHLPEPLVAEAHAEAGLIGDETWRARALAALAPRLPEPLLLNALAMVRAVSSAEARAEALTALLPHLSGGLQTATVSDTLGALRGTSEELRVEGLAALAPYLPDSLATEALDVVRSIVDERWRARALAALAGHLPERLLGDALDMAQSLRDETWVVAALDALAPSLPDSLMGEALVAARPATGGGLGRARVLATLAPYLSHRLLADAVEVAGTMGFGPWRSHVLASLAPYLPASLLPDALAAARAVADDDSRAGALAALAPYLTDALLSEALAAARTIRDQFARARALTPLIPALDEPMKTSALAEALRATEGIRSEARLARALAMLTPVLPEPHLELALRIAGAVREGRWRAEAMATMAPHLSEVLLAEAFAAALTIEEERWRAHALDALARHLPVPLLGQALEAAGAFSEEPWRVQVVTALVPRLQGPMLVSALDIARTIREDRWLARALTALAPGIPESRLPEALRAACAISDEDDRAMVLAALAIPLAACRADAAWSVCKEALPVLAARRRRDLLGDLRSLDPVIVKLGGSSVVGETVQAIVDVGRWWP